MKKKISIMRLIIALLLLIVFIDSIRVKPSYICNYTEGDIILKIYEYKGIIGKSLLEIKKIDNINGQSIDSLIYNSLPIIFIYPEIGTYKFLIVRGVLNDNRIRIVDTLKI